MHQYHMKKQMKLVAQRKIKLRKTQFSVAKFSKLKMRHLLETTLQSFHKN